MRFKDLQAKISIHALRVEGDTQKIYTVTPVRVFLSTPSGWRATKLYEIKTQIFNISIHALRVEGDAIGTGLLEQHSYISIHALRVEGDIINTAFDATQSVFLSTPSGWRATRTPRGL